MNHDDAQFDRLFEDEAPKPHPTGLSATERFMQMAQSASSARRAESIAHAIIGGPGVITDAVPGIQAAPAPTAYADNLPRCPLCAARALAGYVFARYDDIAHDCHCVSEREADYYAGLRRLYRERTELPDFLESLPQRFHTARDTDFLATPNAAFALSLKVLPTSAFIWGATGVGKTRMAAAVAVAAAVRGLSARYISATDYVAAMRAASAPNGPARPDLLHPEVLIVDDLAKMKATDFSYEVLFALIEGRWARERMTLYTANHDAQTTAGALIPRGTFTRPQDTAAAVAALASRLTASVRFEMTGDDQRARGR